MIGAHHQFGQQANGNKLDAHEDEQNRKQKQGPVGQSHAEKLALDGHDEADQNTQRRGEYAHRAKNMQRTGGVAEHEFHGDQIQNHPDCAGYPVFGLAETSGAMIDLDLGKRNAHAAGNGRNEPVHFTVQVDILNNFPAKGFQGAAVIVQSYPGHPGYQAIGHLRGQPPR